MSEVEVRQAGSHVAVVPGDRVVIRVEENATTGYQWSVARTPDPLELESSELALPQAPAPGAAGERRFVFRAHRSGQGELLLTLRRAWEVGESPAATFDVHVTVN